MEKQSIALNQNKGALSSADFNRSPETTILECYKPVKVLNDLLIEVEEKREQRRRKEREAEKAREKQEQIKAAREYYEWQLKKAENLQLVFAILINKKDKIELIPNFDQQAFLEVVDEHLDYKERWVLADIIYKMYEDLDNQINLITLGSDKGLYYQYHKYDPNFESVNCNYNGEPSYSYGGYFPNADFLQMEAERDILKNLSCALDKIATIQPHKEQLETLKQALKA